MKLAENVTDKSGNNKTMEVKVGKVKYVFSIKTSNVLN